MFAFGCFIWTGVRYSIERWWFLLSLSLSPLLLNSHSRCSRDRRAHFAAGNLNWNGPEEKKISFRFSLSILSLYFCYFLFGRLSLLAWFCLHIFCFLLLLFGAHSRCGGFNGVPIIYNLEQVKKKNLMAIEGGRVRSPSRPPNPPCIAKQSSDRLKWCNHARIK